MKNKTFKALTIVLTLFLIAAPITALADDVANNADASVDATYETVSLTVGGSSMTVDLYIVPRNGDGKQGCNLTGGTELVISVTSSNSSVASVSPAQITFTNCESVNTNLTTAVTVSPVATGNANIEFSIVNNNTGGSFNLNTARFKVAVAPPPNTPPVVSVTGVTGGASYEFGAVPAAGCSVTDAEDGPQTVSPVIGSVTGPLSGYGLGSQEVACSYTDTGGLTTTASATYSIVDTNPPTLSLPGDMTAEATSASGAIVVFSPTASDAVDPAPVVSCSPASGSTFPLGETTVNCSATDVVGNSSSGSFKVTVQDTTPPNITLLSRTPANANGWNNGDVTVVWSCSDAVGVISETASATVSTEGENQSVTGTCQDTSGNTASDTQTGINIDKTAPTVSASRAPDANANGWNNTDVTVSFSGTDALSGIDFCDADIVLSAEAAGQSASGACTDKAGNVSNPATISGINIDKTAPTISAALDKSPAATGWFNISTGAPTVSFTCSDALSGLDGDCPVAYTFGEGADQVYSQTVYDKAGNSALAGVSDLDVDLTAPSISASVSPARPASGWWNIASDAPTVTYTCTDATSGVAFCTAPYTFAEGADQSHTGSATDNAGNSASTDVSDIDVDLTAPTLTWNGGPADDGVYYFGFVPGEPTCTAADALSGPNGCTVAGYSAALGNHTMTATAYDMAGNSYAETRAYSVLAWTLKGFYQPVDMNGVYNTVKNGSTVPLKFEIFAGPTELTDVAYVKSLTYALTACNAVAIADEIETVATGGTSLRYDWTGGQFIFNWKTPNTAGKCYRVTMTTQDGSSLAAYFKLK